MDGVWRRGSYGRRGRHTYDPGWDHVREAQWGKDSAPSRPFSARAQFPAPNRPVPPPLLSRNEGAPARTSGFQKPEPVQTEEVKRQPADPQFGQLVRKMHVAIKLVHHLQNVTLKPHKPEPRMISRMEKVLATMIKPAAPTTRTRDLIWGNAKNWGYNTLLILEEHYQTELDKVLDELSTVMVRDWQPAFQVATRWARRNLPHVTQDTLEHAEALIAATGVLEAETAVPQQPPVPTQAPVMRQTPVPTQAPATRQTPAPQPQLPQRPRGQQRGGGTHSTPNRVKKPLRPEPGLPPRQHPRGASQGETQGCGIPKDSRLLDIVEEEEEEAQKEQETGWSPPLGDMDVSGDESRHGSTILTPIPMAQPAAQGEKTSLQEDSRTFTPSPQLRRATRHINTGRKRVDWRLPSTGAQLERGRKQNRALKLRS